jgi:hypothetical protein
MKKMFFVFFLFSMVCLVLNGQSIGNELGADKFYTAFSKVVDNAVLYFVNITTTTSVQTENGEGKKVNIDFPGAKFTSYSSVK